MQRPNPGDPYLPAQSTNGFPASGGYVPPGYGGHTGGFPNQFPASPFAVANPTAPGTGHRSVPSVSELFHSFKRRWLLVLLVGGLLGTVMAAGVWMALPSGKHQVRALIQLRTEAPNIGGQRAPDGEFDRFKEGELVKLRKKEFLQRVAGRPEASEQPLVKNSDDKARSIEWLMETKFLSPEILAVMMNGDDEKQLKKLLTALVEQYLTEATDEQTDERKKAMQALDTAIAGLDKRIKERRDAMNQILKEKGSGPESMAMEKLFISQQIAETMKTMKINQDRKTEFDIRLAQLKGEEASGEYIVDPEQLNAALAANPTVAARQKEADDSQKALADLRAKLLPGSPRIVDEQRNYDKALAAVTAARDATREAESRRLKSDRKQKLARELKDTEFQLALIVGMIEAAKKDKSNLERQHKDLVEGNVAQINEKSDLEPLQEQRNTLAKQRNEMEFNDRQKARVTKMEDPQVYLNYNLKQKMVLATLAGVVGLMAVMLLISYLEWRNRRVDGVDQVVSELGMRVIGTIPAFPSRASLRNGDAGANQNWRFILNESVNSTRTMLLHTAKTQQMQVIMVTSAMQGEGKTSLSSQLATSMATAGLRTLILDFDLRNPSMQKLFDVQVSPGCCEVLLQEVDVSDCVQPTTVPNLWIIPAGQCNHRVIAALAQGHPLEQLFNRLRGQFDVIVVDSCPILPVADSLLVAQHVDGVVFSILQDVSQLPKVMDASEKLVQLNIPLLGAVVNGIKPDIQAYGYNYVKQLPA